MNFRYKPEDFNFTKEDLSPDDWIVAIASADRANDMLEAHEKTLPSVTINYSDSVPVIVSWPRKLEPGEMPYPLKLKAILWGIEEIK